MLNLEGEKVFLFNGGTGYVALEFDGSAADVQRWLVEVLLESTLDLELGPDDVNMGTLVQPEIVSNTVGQAPDLN